MKVSDALATIVPGYMFESESGHSEYQALQMRLRAVEVPAGVLLRAVPGSAVARGLSEPAPPPFASLRKPGNGGQVRSKPPSIKNGNGSGHHLFEQPRLLHDRVAI